MSNDLRFFEGVYDEIGQEKSTEFRPVEMSLVAYRLKNYKAFHDTGWICFTPLVLIYGNNSAGKTAIHNVFMLLRKAYDKERSLIEANTLMLLDDTGAEFGDFKNRRHPDEDMEIQFEFQSTSGEDFIYNLIFSGKDDYRQKAYIKYHNDIYDVLDIYSIKNVFFLKKEKENVDIEFEPIVAGIMKALREFAAQYQYVAPHRVGPSREFVFVGKGNQKFETNEENVYEILFSMIEDNRISNKHINMWMERFGYELVWKSSGPNRGKLMMVDRKSGTETNIIDNGFGIGQSLPVIIRMVTQKNGNMLIDSPEAFLQVNMQSDMADYILECAGNNKTLMIETSSEYILYRIRRRIAEGVFTPEDIRVYFISSKENSDEKIDEIRINRKGEMKSDNPEFQSFFSAGFDDLEYIMTGRKGSA